MITSQTTLGRIIRLPLRLVPRDAVVRILSGPIAGCRWIVGSGDHGNWLGTFERQKAREFAQSIRSGDVVLDLGANIGYYSLIAAKRAGRVFAFEPLPDNIARLRRHLALNRISNVEVIEAAVSDRCGEARFAQGESHSTGKLADFGNAVQTMSLDSLRLERLDIIKCDIEGGELAMLEGARETLRRLRPKIFMATHSGELSRNCAAFLRELGYQVELLSEEELVATSAMPI